MFIRPTVVVYRHDELMCAPGMYRVVICVDAQWAHGGGCSDAVMDDFGDLQRVEVRQ